MQERISNQTRGTRADSIVIDDLTLSADAARARTRIHAALCYTSLVLRTVSAHNTLGATVGGATVVAGLAGADSVVVDGATHAVRAAGRRHTGVGSHWRHYTHTYTHSTHTPLLSLGRS